MKQTQLLTILFSLGLLLFVLPGFGQYDDYVKNMKTACDKINSDKTLQTSQATDPGGTELTGYYKMGALVKITGVTNTTWGQSILDFYFNKGELIYVYELEKINVPDPETGINSLSIRYTGGYFFLQNQVIREVNVVGLKQPVGKKVPKLSFPVRSQKYAALLHAAKM